MTWLYRSTLMKSTTSTVPGTQTRPRSLRARSTSIRCSARSFVSASSSSASAASSAAVAPRGRVPAIGCVMTRPVADLDQRLRAASRRRRSGGRARRPRGTGTCTGWGSTPAAPGRRPARRAGQSTSNRCESTTWKTSPSRMAALPSATADRYSSRSVRCRAGADGGPPCTATVAGAGRGQLRRSSGRAVRRRRPMPRRRARRCRRSSRRWRRAAGCRRCGRARPGRWPGSSTARGRRGRRPSCRAAAPSGGRRPSDR